MHNGEWMLRGVDPNRRLPVRVFGIILLFLISAMLLAIAPLFLDESYSVLSRSISESAAQGLKNAWIARLGFLCFGFAVIWLALSPKGRWPLAALASHLTFGILMASAAAFSHKPWIEGVAVDHLEDLLHSLAASGMGLAFSIGVVSRLVKRPHSQSLGKLFDAVTVTVAISFPLLGMVWSDFSGLMQRMMFFIAYLWFAQEAVGFTPHERAE